MGRGRFEAKGSAYEIKALPLRYILSGEFTGDGLVIPPDENNPGYLQLANLNDQGRRENMDKWMGRLLLKNGRPMSLEQAAGDGWDIEDLGRFLMRVVQMSG